MTNSPFSPEDPISIAANATLDGIARAERITLNEALGAISDHAKEQLPPAVASLLRHLRVMHVAEGLPPRLAAYVLDVGRELRDNAKPPSVP